MTSKSVKLSLLPLRIRAVYLAATAAFLVFVAGGCAFLKPAKSESHYYVLTAVGPANISVRKAAGKSGYAVCLRPVEVANYLENEGMAVCTGTNEIHYALFHDWAEPLGTGIRRVLAEDLRNSPKIDTVITDQPAPAQERLYTIWVRVLKCQGSEANHQDTVAFEAAWEVTGGEPERKTLGQGVFRATPTAWQPGNYNELANQLSKEIADFSQVLVQAVSRRPERSARNNG